MRHHTHRSGIYNNLHVLMLVAVFIIDFARARYHLYALRVCRTADILCRLTGSAAPQNQHALVLQRNSRFFQRVFHSVRVGVATYKLSVLADYGVDAPHFLGRLGHSVKQRHYRLLIRYCHVIAVVFAAVHKIRQRAIVKKLLDVVSVPSEFPVYLGRQRMG